jgi:molybdopterin converting factor small subunit
VRRHINVFVNGELGELETSVAPDDNIDVLPALSGGR